MPSLIPPTPVGGQFGSYTWQDWYNKVRIAINNSATIAWSQITNFTGSNLNQLLTRNHSDLQSILGPASAQGHVPIGGTANQFLQKIDGTVYNYQWGTLMPVANGGTGTATPAIVAGTNVAVSGTWPNQTVAFSGVLPVASGGSGTATPALVAGTNVTVSGSWPNQTINSNQTNITGHAALDLPLTGGTLTGFMGVGSAVTAAWATGTFLGTQYGFGGGVATIYGQNAQNALYFNTNYYYDGTNERRQNAGTAAFIRLYNDGGANGLLVQMAVNGIANSIITWVPVLVIDASGNVSIPAGGLTTGSTTLHTTSVALANGAGASAGTLTNAPAAGNPTKWISINDNGTIRKIPAW